MSPPADLSYDLGVGLEAALMLAGVGLLWRLVLRPEARARRAPDLLAPWPGRSSDLLLLLILCFSAAVFFPIVLNTVLRRHPVSTELQQLLLAAAFQGGLLVGVLGFYLGFGRAWPRLAPAPGTALRTGGVTLLLALPLVYGAAALWQGLLTWAGIPLDQENSLQDFLNIHSPLLRAAFIFIATIVAPVAEELIFRAGLFRYLRRRVPRWMAVLVSSLLFGALHQSLSALAGLVVLAAVCALAYQRTGRIGTAIVAHALFNLTTVVVILLGVNA